MSTSAAPQTDPVSPVVQRLVAASGILFAVLLIVTIGLSGDETPDDGAPLAEWTTFAKDNEDNLRLAALVFGLAAYNFLLFIGYLRSAVGGAERAARGFTRGASILHGAGIAGIVGITIGIGTTAAAMSNPDTPPEVLRAINDLGGGGWILASAGFGACLVTTGLLNMTVRALPAWLGYVALAGGIFFVLQLGVLLDETEDNIFGIFFPLAFLMLIVFCIGASVAFLRDLGRTAPTPTPPA